MKVAIIGAGISGLFLGWKLAQKDEDVTIFERRSKIGKECCSGLFSERLSKFIEVPEDFIENKITGCKIHFPAKTINLKFKIPYFVINHTRLDEFVASLAQKAGAKIILASQQNSLPAGYDRIIGCDGAGSMVRKNLGLKDSWHRFAAQIDLSKENYDSIIETWPIKNGFRWSVPRGKKTEIGIMTDSREVLNQFIKEWQTPNQSPSTGSGHGMGQGKEPEAKPRAAIIPLGLELPKNEKVTLCGDASGLTKPWSGGGVIWQLHQAQILLKNWPDFYKYRKEVFHFFKPQIRFSQILTHLVYFFGFHFPYLIPNKYSIDPDFFIQK